MKLVTVVEYNPNWPKQFAAEAKQLEQTLGALVHRIHHIGSTAVPGLMAKPIIDILLDVKNLDELDAKSLEMEQLGYEVMGEYGIPGRRYFRKGADHRTHHVHTFKSGDQNLVRHLAFRDYLIEHPAIAKEYGTLKFNIAKNCNQDIGNYCDEKDPFVKHHEKIALQLYTK